MRHLNEIELVEFIQGRLQPHRLDEARQHLAECPACSRRLAYAQTMQQAMDAYQPIELKERPVSVDDVVRRAARLQEVRSGYRFGNVAMQKAAAVIVVASLVGAASGFYLSRLGSRRVAAAESLDEQAVASMMHLDVLGPGAITGLDLKLDEFKAFLGSVVSQ